MSWVVTDDLVVGRYFTGAAGGVPGIWQTVVRAETCAIISALKYSLLKQQPMMIFCDNALVVRRFRQLRQGEEMSELHNDQDLWWVLGDLLRQIEWDVQCVHVLSHQNLNQLVGVDWYVCAGNGLADAAAGAALMSLPAEVRKAQAAASTDLRQWETWFGEVVAHYIRVGQQSVRQGKLHLQPKANAMWRLKNRPCNFVTW